MSEQTREVPAFACCSAGIGRWMWVAWESEAAARAGEDAIATGFQKSAALAEAKAAERFGPEARRLPTRWASGYRRRGSAPQDGAKETRSRLSRPPKRPDAPLRLTFLYAAAAKEPPDALGHVAVTRHRIAKQTTGKIHVEADPFDEEEWARRDGESPRVRTLPVDRATLRQEGRFESRRGPTFGSWATCRST